MEPDGLGCPVPRGAPTSGGWTRPCPQTSGKAGGALGGGRAGCSRRPPGGPKAPGAWTAGRGGTALLSHEAGRGVPFQVEMLCSMNKTNWEIFLYLGGRIIALGGTHAAAGTVRISLENRNLNRAGASGIRSPSRSPSTLLGGGLWKATPGPPVKGQGGASEGGPGLGGFRVTMQWTRPLPPTPLQRPPEPSHTASPWSGVTSPPLKAGPEAQLQAGRSCDSDPEQR